MIEVCVAIGIGSRCIRVGFNTIFVSSLYNRYKATKKRGPSNPPYLSRGMGPEVCRRVIWCTDSLVRLPAHGSPY